MLKRILVTVFWDTVKAGAAGAAAGCVCPGIWWLLRQLRVM
jgi:hypothetical protein